MLNKSIIKMEANMPIAGIYGPDDFAHRAEVRPNLPASRHIGH